MIKYCDENSIYWFHELANYSSKNKKSWFQIIVTDSGTRFLSSYLSSKAYKVGLLTDEQYREVLNKC